LSKQQISDNIREEKINKLSVELRECVAKKKREFEQVIEENIYLKIIFLIFKFVLNPLKSPQKFFFSFR